VPASARQAGVRDQVSAGHITLTLAGALAASARSYPLRVTSQITPDLTSVPAASATQAASARTQSLASSRAVASTINDPIESDHNGFVETQNGTASDGNACNTLKNWNVQTDPQGNAISTNAWGFCEGLDQTYYMFNTSGLTSSMHVTQATLNIWENYSANQGACSTSYPINLYDLGDTDAVVGSGTTEKNEPSLTGSEEIGTDTIGLGPNPDSANNCPQRNPQYDVTSDMQTVANAGDINFWNYGLQSGDKTSSDAFARFGYNPDIETIFDMTPPAPPYQLPTPAPTVSPGGATSRGCSGATPWIGATPSIQLNADFEPASGMPENVYPEWKWSNFDTSGSSGVSPLDTNNVTPGSRSLTLPTLTDGETYTYQAATRVNFDKLDNGSGYTTWGPDCSFDLDLTPPSTPAVTSSAFPASGSAAPNPIQGTAGTFGFSSSDPAPSSCSAVLPASSGHCLASGVYEFVYSLNQPLPANLPATQGCSGSGAAYAISAATTSGTATATSCSIKPGNWGTNTLYVEAVDSAGNVSQSYQYDFYVTWNKGALVTPGDVNGDGIPDLLATTASGNLLVYPGGADPALSPTTASTAADSPQPGTGWNKFEITHRGSWTPSQEVDDLFALKGADLYRYIQNNETDTGVFENGANVFLMNFPACPTSGIGADPDNTSNCTGYPSSWSGFDQILAPGDVWAGAPSGTGIANDTGYPSLLAVDSAGSLWLFQGRAGGQLQDPIQLGSTGWNTMTIIAPGTVAGQNTLWARDNSTGDLYSYPFALDPASNIPTLDPAHPGTPVPAEATGTTATQISGITLPQSSFPTVTSPGPLTGGACTTAGSVTCPGLYAEDTTGSIWYYPGQPATGGAAALTGSHLLVGGLDSGAQFSWSLADGSGSTTADASGNGNTGTLSSGVTWATDPSRGTVAQFNGTTGGVTASNPVLSIRSGPSWSASAWADPTVTDQYQDILSQDGTQTSGFHLDVTSGGFWGFRRPLTDSASPSVVQATSSTPVQTHTWTFLTATFNGSTGQMNLYVNGKLAATANDPTPFATSGSTAAGRGLFGGASADWFSGSISDAEGFNYQLSASQVQAIYDANGQAGLDGIAQLS
jgi:hypothetical protein